MQQIAKCQWVGVTFCDLEKAFDCVNHRILLDKLELYGIVGKFHLLLKTVFLSLLMMRSHTPTGKRLKVGFHKAWFFDPLPFLLYISNLPKIATKDGKVIMVADDTSIIVTNSNDTHLKTVMNEIFMDINKWCKT